MEFPRFNLEYFENSVGRDRKKRSKELDKICSEIGFLVLEGHGVSQKIISDQWIIVSEFFSSPLEIKREVKVPFLGYPYGCLLYTSPSPRDATLSRMPSSA